MWFEPGNLSKTKTKSLANSANPANYEPENTKTAPPISKLAELAAPFDSEINDDHQKIINWLISIGEDDQKIIAETLHRCKAHPDTLSYFLQRADGIAKPH
ncbi:MAG: hypothetical protein Q7U66_04170 [Methylobacter sp.]|nr:hypothetical protein [Methylobacter sp.]